MYSRVLCQRLDADLHVLLARHQPVPLGFRPTVERLPFGRGLRWPVAPFVLPPPIAKCARRHDRTVLVSHASLFTGPACVLAGRRTGLPVVVHAHHLETWGLARLVERWALRRADRVVVDSQFVRRQVIAQGVAQDRIMVVYCGVDPPVPVSPDAAQRALEGLGIWSGNQIVLSIGPVIARKAPLEMVRAFAAVARSARRAKLVWLGAGPWRASALGLASDLGIGDRVVFPGHVPEIAKHALLQEATVFVFGSRLEGFPLSVLEAMAAGLPVLAYRAASLPELLGQAGVLAHSPTDFTHKLAELLRLPRWRQSVATDCLVRAGEFTWGRTVEGVRTAYSKDCT